MNKGGKGLEEQLTVKTEVIFRTRVQLQFLSGRHTKCGVNTRWYKTVLGLQKYHESYLF